MEKRLGKIKKAMIILLCVDAVILIPCFIASLRWILLLLTKIDIFEINVFDKIFEFFAIPYLVPLFLFIIGQCFFLPEIFFLVSVILQIFYFVSAKKSEQRIKRTAVTCVVLDIFCVTALLSAQAVFDRAMSV